jgi:hypothetical protein
MATVADYAAKKVEEDLLVEKAQTTDRSLVP